MASNTMNCEIVASDMCEPTTIQLDEEHHAIFVLTNDRLTRVDLIISTDNSQTVCQHNRKLQEASTDDVDCYSQGESADEDRVSDPYDDSEPSTDDDEEKIAERRNWRRHFWRKYQLDNACSMLFLPGENRLVVLNEGVITFLTVELENGRPFAQGPSKNIFCYDYDVFNGENKPLSVQPWSIAPVANSSLFIFSLLNSAQLYSLDMRNESTIIKTWTTTPVIDCPYLLFHPQSNILFVHDSTQVFAVSLADETTVKLVLPNIEKENTIAAMAIDKTGHVYILSGRTIFKYAWGPQLQLIERLETSDVPRNYTHMAIKGTGTEFYLSDTEAGRIFRWRKEST